ncbi:MAG TPA: hypothetical protein VFX59_03435 [Polyangiales bacterium]|nr:hypothetical protein [Polyangiales bacterium]
MARAKKKRRWSQLLRAQLPLPGALLAVWALGLLEPWLYLGALVRELGFHLALLALAGVVFALVRRYFVAAAALAGVAVLFALPLWPFYRATKPTPQSGPLLRVASLHLNGAELSSDTLAAWLARERPDAVALTGLRSDLGQASFDTYRVARSSDLRALLLVQAALAVPQRETLRGHASMLVRAGRCQARVVTLELPAIAAYAELDVRARMIDAARRLHSAPRSVWLGQLGSRAEAHDLQAFFADHQLRDARLGHGRLATAPASLGPLGFPLSSALVHGWISVRELNVMPPIVDGAHGSLTAVLELTEPRCRFSRDVPPE